MTEDQIGADLLAWDFVLSYLDARYRWEVAATRALGRAEGTQALDFVIKKVQDEYRGLLREFCSEAIVGLDLAAALRDPPSVDATKTSLASVRTRGGRVIVATSEATDPRGDVETFEYVLERAGDRFVLADRRTRNLNGRWIHRVL